MAGVDMSAVASVTRDLAEIAERDPKLAISAEAATALAMARELDSHNSATSKSMCARALNETMEKLRAMAPPAETKDRVDEIAAQRLRRRAQAK